jgi:hypothetical protein
MRFAFQVLFIFILVFCNGCKKNKKDNTNPSNTSASSNTSPPTGSFIGQLHSTWNVIIDNLQIAPVTNTFVSYYAQFYSSLVPPITVVAVNSVSCNGDNLNYWSSNHSYNCSATSSVNADIWIVNGSGPIPSFTYTDSSIRPFLDVSDVPDSVSISTGCSFTVDVNNSSLSDINFANMGSTTLASGNNSVLISAASLSAVAVGTSVISATASHTYITNLNGKDFLFSKNVLYTKQVKINP